MHDHGRLERVVPRTVLDALVDVYMELCFAIDRIGCFCLDIKMMFRFVATKARNAYGSLFLYLNGDGQFTILSYHVWRQVYNGKRARAIMSSASASCRFNKACGHLTFYSHIEAYTFLTQQHTPAPKNRIFAVSDHHFLVNDKQHYCLTFVCRGETIRLTLLPFSLLNMPKDDCEYSPFFLFVSQLHYFNLRSPTLFDK